MEDKKEGILLGNKVLHNKAFHAIANSKTEIPLGKNFTIHIYPINKDFNVIELYLNEEPITKKYTYIPRVKKIVTKAKSLIPPIPSSQVKLKEEVESEELI